MGSDFPRAGSDFPRVGSDFPRAGSDFPRVESDFPHTESDFPRVESDFPRGESDFPRGGIDFPCGEIQFPRVGKALRFVRECPDLSLTAAVGRVRARRTESRPPERRYSCPSARNRSRSAVALCLTSLACLKDKLAPISIAVPGRDLRNSCSSLTLGNIIITQENRLSPIIAAVRLNQNRMFAWFIAWR
jgi:hypothetical protein